MNAANCVSSTSYQFGAVRLGMSTALSGHLAFMHSCFLCLRSLQGKMQYPPPPMKEDDEEEKPGDTYEGLFEHGKRHGHVSRRAVCQSSTPACMHTAPAHQPSRTASFPN